jgi:hypothetical protein
MKKELNVKVGDTVTGMFLSDIKEELGNEIVERQEIVTKITPDGSGYSLVETNFTKTLAAEIAAKNKEIAEDSEKINTDWCINHSNNAIRVIQEIKAEKDLSAIGGKLTPDGFVELEHMEYPKELFESLKPFIEYLEGKDVVEIINPEEEVSLIISGIEFKPSILKTIIQ